MAWACEDRSRRMKPIVLDTDVVSFLFRTDSRAQLYPPHLDNRQWFISFMTEAELEQWAGGLPPLLPRRHSRAHRAHVDLLKPHLQRRRVRPQPEIEIARVHE